MSIDNIANGSKIISSTHNNNYSYLLNEIITLKARANQLEINSATKAEIINEADLLASNIINDTSGVSGHAVSNALLGLKLRIDNINEVGINADVALYDMEDLVGINDYSTDEYTMTLFPRFTVALYVENTNTGASTLDVGDINGAVPIKIIEEDGTKRDVVAGEIYSWNLMQFDGVNFILLDKTLDISSKLGDRSQLTTDDKSTLVKAINELDLVKAEKSETYTRTDIDDKDDDLAGVGRTTETIKDNYDNIESHKANDSNPHLVTANQVGAYSKTEMQTSGSSQMHWDNITDLPNFADSSWKPAVSTYDLLPTTDNTLNDMRVVADDSTSPESLDGGGTAIYTCIAITGIISEQWDKLADLDWTNDHGALVGLGDDDHPQYLRHDGTRALTGNLDYSGNQALNMVLQNSSTLPLDLEGLIYYDTNTKEAKLNTSSGVDIISGAGALIREVEITSVDAQAIFDVSQGGLYSYAVGSGVMNVYRKNANGYYELLDKDDYYETDNQTITLKSPVGVGVEFYFKWMKNIATIASAIESDSITNDKLGTDIKIGSLASLNTTAKDNITNSINEVLSLIRTNEQIEDVVGGLVTGGTNIVTNYDDIANSLSVSLSITDTEILNKIKNVDGTLSGLDADLLDGQHASEFQPAGDYQPAGSYQPAGTYNTVIGTSTNINTSGSFIIDSLTMTDGVITAHDTRSLTPADIGALANTGGSVSGDIVKESGVYPLSFLQYHKPFPSPKTATDTSALLGTDHVDARFQDVYALSSTSGLVTYQQAVEHATSMGGRLPTIEELEALVTSGSGSSYDNEICWTQTPASAGKRYVNYGKFDNFDIDPANTRQELDESSTAVVRWVADLNRVGKPVTFDNNMNIYVDGSIYESGTALSSKYLGISSKASDSELLDSLDSTQFLRSDISDSMAGGLTLGSSTSRSRPAEGIEMYGSTSSAILGVQDGNGRLQLKWNASDGTSEIYLASGEPAFFWDMGISTTPIWEMKYDSGGTIGGTIPWTTMLSLETDGNLNINNGRLEIEGSIQPKTTVATTAPSSPATNDIWIDTSS